MCFVCWWHCMKLVKATEDKSSTSATEGDQHLLYLPTYVSLDKSVDCTLTCDWRQDISIKKLLTNALIVSSVSRIFSILKQFNSVSLHDIQTALLLVAGLWENHTTAILLKRFFLLFSIKILLKCGNVKKCNLPNLDYVTFESEILIFLQAMKTYLMQYVTCCLLTKIVITSWSEILVFGHPVIVMGSYRSKAIECM